MSLQQLRNDRPVDVLATKLLARAAWLAPGEPIPRDLLLATLGSVIDEAREIPRGLSRLVRLGLLEQVGIDVLRLHRLLAAFARDAVPDERAQLAVEETLAATVDKRNREGIPLTVLPLQTHLRAVETAAAARGSPHAAALANELGYHLVVTGDLAAARVYLERALADRKSVV